MSDVGYLHECLCKRKSDTNAASRLVKYNVPSRSAQVGLSLDVLVTTPQEKEQRISGQVVFRCKYHDTPQSRVHAVDIFQNINSRQQSEQFIVQVQAERAPFSSRSTSCQKSTTITYNYANKPLSKAEQLSRNKPPFRRNKPLHPDLADNQPPPANRAAPCSSGANLRSIHQTWQASYR
jgi:hypothetical protein